MDSFLLSSCVVKKSEPPPEPIPAKDLLGIDKLAFYVAKPDNLNKLYEITGEFIGGAFEENGVLYNDEW